MGKLSMYDAFIRELSASGYSDSEIVALMARYYEVEATEADIRAITNVSAPPAFVGSVGSTGGIPESEVLGDMERINTLINYYWELIELAKKQDDADTLLKAGKSLKEMLDMKIKYVGITDNGSKKRQRKEEEVIKRLQSQGYDLRTTKEKGQDDPDA